MFKTKQKTIFDRNTTVFDKSSFNKVKGKTKILVAMLVRDKSITTNYPWRR